MLAAILLVAGFQCYWLNRLYKDELNGLKKETDVLLRTTVQQLQNKNLRVDSTFFEMPLHDKFREANIAEGKMPPPPQSIMFNKFSTDSIKIKHQSREGKNFTFRKHAIADSNVVIRRMPLSVLSKNQQIDSLMALAGGKGNIKIMINETTDSVKTENNQKQLVQSHIHYNKKRNDTTVYIDNNSKHFIRATIEGKIPNASAQLKSLVLQLRSLYDSIPVKKVDSLYKIKLAENKIPVAHELKMYWQKDVKVGADSGKLSTGYAEIGFNSPYAYKAAFTNPFWFIVQKLSMPIIVSLLLIIITTLSFVYLYRNLAAQQRLALIKDEFISNITHELKTPIATVNVAIEALKNFGGIQDPEKTKEYLNISSAELQRLSLLVDKVLKLSMFENKAITLNKENFDIKVLMEEVINSMQLQALNQQAIIELNADGNYFLVHADKLHITSVLFNLIDNALKYSPQNAVIKIFLQRQEDKIMISVKDKGIGIAPEYQHKIFDKFFREPTGGHHNVKGYGLGLSYVSEIIKKHNGTITVQSEKGNGSTFIIQLPVA